MAEKTLNTRIQLKYDTYENWTTNNPVLKTGEVAIATIASNQDGVQNAPSVIIKVGDGTSDYKTLKFMSGLAADVYSWAKAENKPTYTADEIDGLADYISGEIQDTDTQYQIVKVDDYNYKLQSKSVGGEWADVADGTIVIPKYDDTALAGRVTSLEGLVGTTAVATQIANAIAALDLANTYEAKGAAAAVQADLDSYKETNDIAVAAAQEAANTAQSTADDAKASIDAFLAEADATETAIDTLKEIQAELAEGEASAASMLAAINQNKAALETLNGDSSTDGSVDKKIADAIAAENLSQYAKDADLAAIAKTGNVNDLVQTAGDTLIFDCGNSVI